LTATDADADEEEEDGDDVGVDVTTGGRGPAGDAEAPPPLLSEGRRPGGFGAPPGIEMGTAVRTAGAPGTLVGTAAGRGVARTGGGFKEGLALALRLGNPSVTSAMFIRV